MIWKLAELALGGVAGWFERKQKLAEVKATAEATVLTAEANARAQIALKSADAEIEWDREGLNQMKYSWKDEYLVIVWTSPLWLAMLPFDWAQRASTAFFETITNAPPWYIGGMAVMIAASFGVRKAIDIIKHVKA